MRQNDFEFHYEKLDCLTLHQSTTCHMKYYYTFEYQSDPAVCNKAMAADRDAVSRFLDGNAPESVVGTFVKQIGRITAGRTDGWEICFVPADSFDSTCRRYSSLADSLRKRTGVDVCIETLAWKSGRDSRNPEFSCTSEKGRNVILIDGVVDSGRTINAAAAALVGAGARSVTGLVAGKTVA